MKKPWGLWGTAPEIAADRWRWPGRQGQPFFGHFIDGRVHPSATRDDSKSRKPLQRGMLLATLRNQFRPRSDTPSLLHARRRPKWVKLGGHGVRGSVCIGAVVAKNTAGFLPCWNAGYTAKTHPRSAAICGWATWRSGISTITQAWPQLMESELARRKRRLACVGKDIRGNSPAVVWALEKSHLALAHGETGGIENLPSITSLDRPWLFADICVAGWLCQGVGIIVDRRDVPWANLIVPIRMSTKIAFTGYQTARGTRHISRGDSRERARRLDARDWGASRPYNSCLTIMRRIWIQARAAAVDAGKFCSNFRGQVWLVGRLRGPCFWVHENLVGGRISFYGKLRVLRNLAGGKMGFCGGGSG